MNRKKCLRCGLINLSADISCRRCDGDLKDFTETQPTSIKIDEGTVKPASRSVRIATIVFIGAIVLGGYEMVSTYQAYNEKIEASSRAESDRKIAANQAMKAQEANSQRDFEEGRIKLQNELLEKSRKDAPPPPSQVRYKLQ